MQQSDSEDLLKARSSEASLLRKLGVNVNPEYDSPTAKPCPAQSLTPSSATHTHRPSSGKTSNGSSPADEVTAVSNQFVLMHFKKDTFWKQFCNLQDTY